MNYKVIITGPVGSGKTAAVDSLNNKSAVHTDSVVSGSDLITRQHKKTTTVAMDFDVITLENGNTVHVYGTPGQERFDFMWDILSQGANGIILLLDITRNYPLRDLKYYTSRFSELISSSQLIIGLTHADVQTNFSIEPYKKLLKSLSIEADVIPIDARNKGDVTWLFHALLDIPSKIQKAPKFMTKQKVIEEQADKIETSKKSIWNLKLPFIQKETTSDVLDIEVDTKIEVELAESITFTEHALNKVGQVKHVNSVSLTNSMGKLLHTTTDDEGLNDFIAFLSGITPEIESTLNRGKIHRIMLRSPKEDNLTLFIEEEQSLGVSSDRAVSVQTLSQQIEDLLQWL